MDLRGIARINDTVQYVAGGMLADQQVSDKVFKLEWHRTTTGNVAVSAEDGIEVFPIPFDDHLYIRSRLNGQKPTGFDIFNGNGQLVESREWNGSDIEIATDSLPDGVYVIKVYLGGGEIVRKVMKQGL
jgi:hypothetical protein